MSIDQLMNREAYRKNKKKETINTPHKELLFSRIERTISSETMQSRTSVLTRRSHYVRPVARVSGVLMLGVAVFLLTYVSDTFQTQDGDTGMLVVVPVVSSTVQANPLGRIITAQGTIRGEQEGKIFDVSDISEGQFVILDEGARVVLAIDESVEATITGPARFSLEVYDENTTLLNLIEGTYAEVKTRIIQEDVNVIETDGVEQTTKRDLIVKTKTLQIATTTQEGVDLIIDASNQQEAKITNEGSSIIVKNLDTTESIAIDTNHVAIRDLTNSLATVEVGESQISSLNEAENKQLLAIRYEANDEQSAALSTFLQKGVDEENSLNEDIKDAQIGVDESVLQALIEQDEVLGNDQQNEQAASAAEPSIVSGRVIEPERMERLQGLLTIDSLVDEYVALSDDVEKQSLVIEQLVNIINSALGEFNVSGANTASKENLIRLINSLLDVLNNDYFIPPSLTQPLIKLQSVLLQ